MSEFLARAVSEANNILDTSSVSLDTQAVEGKTTQPCPICGKSRSRSYGVWGPYYRSELPANARELKPRLSNHVAWRYCGLAWLASPPISREGKIWYEIHIFATCRKHGLVRITEREGIRRFSRFSRVIIKLKSWLHAGIDRIVPL
ncbi:MAG: hypothetical protein KGJ35_01225 [Patescibacteria group bacterium]|nr:hypothetical protein [Patescibacteria group bacterium]